MSRIDSMKFWVQQLSNRDEETLREYQIYFLKFAKWMNLSPNELIQMKKEALAHDGDRRENMVLEGKVKEFMKYLEKDAVWYADHMRKNGPPVKKKVGYGLGTRKLAYAAVLSFFELNQYPLNMKRGDRPTGEAIGSRIPEASEVLKLVNAAKSRGVRAAILFLKDSGLRISDVVLLRWSDIQQFDEGFIGFKVITQKRGILALPFVGPETVEALDQLPRKDDRIFPVEARYLSIAISGLIVEAGLKEGLTAHGLRKFFNTELQNARVPKEHRYTFMGKKVSVYDENRQIRLFQIYKENYTHLRVFGIVDREEIEQIIEKRVQQRVAELMEGKVTRKQFNDLKKQLLELEKKLGLLKP